MSNRLKNREDAVDYVESILRSKDIEYVLTPVIYFDEGPHSRFFINSKKVIDIAEAGAFLHIKAGTYKEISFEEPCLDIKALLKTYIEWNSQEQFGFCLDKLRQEYRQDGISISEDSFPVWLTEHGFCDNCRRTSPTKGLNTPPLTEVEDS